MAHWAGGSVSLVSVSHCWCTAPAWPCSSALLSGLFQMKTGPFAEHSNQLWNISAVPSWSKVNQGLIRMYKAEVSAGGGQGEAGSRFPSWPHRSLCLLHCGSALCCLHLVPVGAGACHSQLCSLLRGSEEGAAGQKKAPACTMFAPKPVPKQCFFQTRLLPFLVFP